MKKLVIVLVVVMLTLGIVIGIKPTKNENLIRIHIRANSDTEVDLDIQTDVRNEVIGYLSSRLIECENKAEAYKLIQDNMDNIEAVANRTIKSKNASYKARVVLREEELPTRQYLDYRIEQGIYDSLTIELGKASGEDWWCVAYPPICFNGEGDYHYKSRLKELIEKYL